MPPGEPPAALPARRRSWTVLWTVLILLGLLGATALVMAWAWSEIGDVEISGHGLIALGLGAGLTLLVGVGLMTLVFFSSRRGFDERAHDWSQNEYRRRPDEDQDGR
jgi:hypothetical protein